MDKRRDHGDDISDSPFKWICLREAPISHANRWSYGCDYCMIRLAAGIKAGELDDLLSSDAHHLVSIAESLEQWHKLRGREWLPLGYLEP